MLQFVSSFRQGLRSGSCSGWETAVHGHQHSLEAVSWCQLELSAQHSQSAAKQGGMCLLSFPVGVAIGTWWLNSVKGTFFCRLEAFTR